MKLPPRLLLLRRLALVLFLLAVPVCLRMTCLRAVRRQRCAERLRLLRTLAPDLARLARHERVAAALRAAPRAAAGGPALPADFPPPERREVKLLAVAGEWRGVQAELAWPRLETAQAFSLLSCLATGHPPWRVVRMSLEALPEPGQARLALTLESAEPASAAGGDHSPASAFPEVSRLRRPSRPAAAVPGRGTRAVCGGECAG